MMPVRPRFSLQKAQGDVTSLGQGMGAPTQQTAHRSSGEGHPEIGGEADDEHGQHRSGTSAEEDRFAADAVGEATPEHAGDALSEGKGGDEESRIEG